MELEQELRAQLQREREEHAAAIQAAKEAQILREESLWGQVEKTQSEQRVRHQSEILELTHTFQSQLKKQLTEQASSEPVRSAETDEPSQQADLEALQLRLSQEKEEEVMVVRVQTEQIWRERLETLQAQHRLQLNQLNDELEHLRTKEEGLLTMLETQERELQTALEANTKEPEPRQRKQADIPASSKPHFNTAWQETLSVKKSPPRSGTPPSAVPRRKLHLSLQQDQQQLEVSQNHGGENKTSSETESTTSEESQQQTVDKMKAALQQNPEIMRALRTDVEMHVDIKLAELGVDEEVRGLGQRQAAQIAALNSHQRKLASKKFAEYAAVREEVEGLVSQRLEAQHPESVREEKVKPMSKGKKSSFLSKLYHRSKKQSQETQLLTSTPIHTEQPQSILKMPRDWPRATEAASISKSAPSSPVMDSRALERAQSSQSLPAPKAVTFARPEEEFSASFVELSKPKQERPKSAFQSSKPEPARTPISGDIFLAIPKLTAGADQKNKTQNMSDLSWDLEDL
ncbi:hypothetical protein B566_EDAN014306 [Ephemera danica]|nr:hypothetical protein B566_EDAN014306 [Ephemera danica]